MSTEPEKISPANLTDIMQTAYIDYSMSVIVSRALPDARDGLKPVQRRILYAMLREGLLHNRAFDKCAGVVGEVLKNYHPHGDSSVYDTLVRMAQGWVMRYPLIDPQGNFGSVDGDPPAAYRYTEARLREIASELLSDIDEETVDFIPNYKESTTEPSVLPSGLPNLLMNGSTGIAVGMATNIPPHNLDEIIDAACAMIDNPDISMDEIVGIIKGPDFPTGGIIAGRAGIDSYLRTGRGIVRIRGKAHIEEQKSGKEHLVVTEIPYYVNRSNLVKQIAELVSTKRLDEVSDLRDESDENTRIVIEIKRGESSKVVTNKLFKMTQLESSFGVILLALDNKRPKEMNIKELLDCFIEHRRDVLYRRTAFRLRKAEERAHILEGYKIALDNLDDFVRIIRASSNRDEAKARLMDRYPLSERQTNAILDLRLYQLTGLEREKIEQEYMELLQVIEQLRAILASAQLLLDLVKSELLALKPKYSQPRRTELIAAEGDFRMEDVIANEGCIITVTHAGMVKRTALDEYREQRRGGKGIIGTDTYEEDFVEHLFTASTHDYIMFFMNNGRVYVEKVYEIPEYRRDAKGKSINSVLALQPDEKVAAMICVKEFSADLHLVMATRGGTVKKTCLADYGNPRKGGVIGIKLTEGDSLLGCVLTNGNDDVVLITRHGMSIRFPESDLRDQGRATQGVRGIALKKEGDAVQSIDVVNPENTLLVASEEGIGKRSSFEEYRIQKRGGSGIITMKLREGFEVAGALSVSEDDQIMLLTAKGQSVRCPVADIRTAGRNTQGVKLVELKTNDKLLAVARVVEVKDENAGETSGEESADSDGSSEVTPE